MQDNTVSKTRTMVSVAVATAIICILAPLSISIPMSPVPISLAVFAIFIATYALGMKYGLLSVLLYLLLGFIGLPVFSKFMGGPSVLAGPTGGYIIGYLYIAFFTGLMIERFETKRTMHVIGMVLGTALCYLFGTSWLAYTTGLTFREALFAGVIPFIPADAVKIIIAILIGPKLRRALNR